MFDVLAIAIAHPTRQAMLDVLGSDGSIGMGELAELLGIAASTTTYHVDVLERAGLVARRRFGTSVFVEARASVEIVLTPTPLDGTAIASRT